MANPFFVNKNNFYSTALKLLIFIILENNLHQNSLVGPCLCHYAFFLEGIMGDSGVSTIARTRTIF